MADTAALPAGAPDAPARAGGAASGSGGATDRFLLELEFVQALANPSYLNWLAQNRTFDDKAFVEYLRYLQYWKRPEYASFIVYPHCLYFLDLLQDKAFRAALASTPVKELIHREQLHFWQFYRANRLKTIGHQAAQS